MTIHSLVNVASHPARDVDIINPSALDVLRTRKDRIASDW